MILSDSNEGVLLVGTVEEISNDMLNIMSLFVEDIDSIPEGKEIIKKCFYTKPEIVTDFTRMFVKATHK